MRGMSVDGWSKYLEVKMGLGDYGSPREKFHFEFNALNAAPLKPLPEVTSFLGIFSGNLVS